jgi:heme/copper-type cytochrome/quinol oxidase subunit 1
MRAIDRLSQPQRVVVVIAPGLVLAAVGSYLVNLGGGATFGWLAYAPLTSARFVPGNGLATWLRLIIWLALIASWAAASVRVLKPSAGRSPPGEQ